jgi:2-keto-4-pentenoate hydratase/2-oxohepta-3-ene-1,7-dioic acid hydratase in catechol pathway
VFGYTVANDVTARDRQAVPHPEGGFEYRLGPGKNFDTCAPIGPWIVTRDEIDDPQQLGLRTYVNGDLRQSNSTAKMIWDVATLVSFFSDFYTLQPGVLIETGTPGGTAWATDPEIGGKPYERGDVKRAGYLQPGDVVTVEIDGIGSLTNRIVSPGENAHRAGEETVAHSGG